MNRPSDIITKKEMLESDALIFNILLSDKTLLDDTQKCKECKEIIRMLLGWDRNIIVLFKIGKFMTKFFLIQIRVAIKHKYLRAVPKLT